MATEKKSALEKALPAMAKDIGVMKMGIMKLVAVQTGTPRTKAEQFFAGQQNKESAYEAKYGKSPTPTKSSSGGGSRSSKGLGFGPGTSVLDFIKNIANVLIKGALLSLGTMGIAKLLENDSIRENIKSFLKNLFLGVLNVIQKGATMLTDMVRENWPEIKETIISTLVAIKDLLVTGIKKAADVLSDPRIWEGVWEIIQVIFSSIKKILSTEIDINGEKVSLGVVLGAVIIAFGALKGAVWLLKAAADSAAKSLFGVGGGDVDVPDKGKDKGKKGPYRDPKTGRFTKTPPVEPVTMGNRLLAGSFLTALGYSAYKLSEGMAENIQAQNQGGLEYLSGFGDDTGLAAHIEMQGRGSSPTPASKNQPTTSPSQVAFGQTTPLTAEQANAAVSETKKYIGKNTVDYITAKEGFAAKAYLDPPGNNKNQYSIGHGHLIQPHEVKQGYILLGDGKKIQVKGPGGKDTTITKAEAKQLLNSDLPKYEKAAADPLGPEAWSKLNEDQKTALISYAYNAGSTAGLVKAGLKDAIMKGDMERAAEIIYQKGAKTAGGKYLTALERRRLSESTLFAGAQFPNPYGKPPSENIMAASQEKIAAQQTPNPEEQENSLVKMLANFDKMIGGKLGIDSAELTAAWKMIEKEISSGPTFVDNSTSVSKSGSEMVTAQGSPAVRDENLLNAIMKMNGYTQPSVT